MNALHTDSITALIAGTLFDLLRTKDAYLDPGSGSYLLQLLIAGLLGGMFAIRASWGKIKNFFRRGSKVEEEVSSDDEES
jgi:hypothetical protein